MQYEATSAAPRQFLNSRILLVLPDNLTTQNQTDIHNSLLISQLAADKLHVRDEHTSAWHQEFSITLGHLGWLITSNDFQINMPRNATFDLATFALNEISQRNLADQHVDAFRKLTNILRKLPSNGDVLQLLYQGRTEVSKTAGLMLAVGELSTDNRVILNIFSFHIIDGNEGVKNYLEHIYDPNSITLDTTVKSSRMLLDEQVHGGVRELVTERLGDRPSSMIKEIMLASMLMPASSVEETQPVETPDLDWSNPNIS